MNTQAYPLQWPTGYPRTDRPKESRFGHWNRRPTIHAATELLLDELRLLQAQEIVISTNQKLRRDGLPYSRQGPEINDTGVAVYFQLRGEPRVVACDQWASIGENIHAIAKTIGAMRGIDRWGCSDMLQRMFTGFAALPAAGASSAGRTWWEVLGVDPDADYDDVRSEYKRRLLNTHPDRGGDADAFQEVREAWEEFMNQYNN